MTSDSDAALGCIILTIAIIVILSFSFGLHACSSYMEAKAYNRATHSNVSWWDAMWVELRVTPN